MEATDARFYTDAFDGGDFFDKSCVSNDPHNNAIYTPLTTTTTTSRFLTSSVGISLSGKKSNKKVGDILSFHRNDELCHTSDDAEEKSWTTYPTNDKSSETSSLTSSVVKLSESLVLLPSCADQNFSVLALKGQCDAAAAAIPLDSSNTMFNSGGGAQVMTDETMNQMDFPTTPSTSASLENQHLDFNSSNHHVTSESQLLSVKGGGGNDLAQNDCLLTAARESCIRKLKRLGHINSQWARKDDALNWHICKVNSSVIQCTTWTDLAPYIRCLQQLAPFRSTPPESGEDLRCITTLIKLLDDLRQKSSCLTPKGLKTETTLELSSLNEGAFGNVQVKGESDHLLSRNLRETLMMPERTSSLLSHQIHHQSDQEIISRKNSANVRRWSSSTSLPSAVVLGHPSSLDATDITKTFVPLTLPIPPLSSNIIESQAIPAAADYSTRTHLKLDSVGASYNEQPPAPPPQMAAVITLLAKTINVPAEEIRMLLDSSCKFAFDMQEQQQQQQKSDQLLNAESFLASTVSEMNPTPSSLPSAFHGVTTSLRSMKGVSFDKSKRNWEASWLDARSGRRVKKCFSEGRWGSSARDMAILARKEAEESGAISTRQQTSQGGGCSLPQRSVPISPSCHFEPLSPFHSSTQSSISTELASDLLQTLLPSISRSVVAQQRVDPSSNERSLSFDGNSEIAALLPDNPLESDHHVMSLIKSHHGDSNQSVSHTISRLFDLLTLTSSSKRERLDEEQSNYIKKLKLSETISEMSADAASHEALSTLDTSQIIWRHQSPPEEGEKKNFSNLSHLEEPVSLCRVVPTKVDVPIEVTTSHIPLSQSNEAQQQQQQQYTITPSPHSQNVSHHNSQLSGQLLSSGTLDQSERKDRLLVEVISLIKEYLLQQQQ